MNSVLIVSSSPNAEENIRTLLPCNSYSPIEATESGGAARRHLLEQSFDLVVINTPLTDEYGDMLAVDLAANADAVVMLIVRSDHADILSTRIGELGIMVIPKPVNRALFSDALRLAAAVKCAISRVRKENSKLEGKIAEIRTIDRAKCVLIGVLGMSEPQAHRYIEKQAMDMRISRIEVAENILKTYET